MPFIAEFPDRRRGGPWWNRSRLRVTLASLAVALVGLAGRPAAGQELYATFGGQHTKDPSESTYSWSAWYQHNINENLFATFTWLNEGHVTNHHRDGHSLQIWGRWLSPERRFTLSAGVGPYRYYDTTQIEGAAESTDEHGYGVMGSVAAHWYFRHPWVAVLRYNYTYTTTSITTNTVDIGFGYQFDLGTRPGPVVPAASYGFSSPERNEVTVMIGKSIVNNFQSPKGAAWGIEYRRRLTPYVDVTGTFLDEGDSGVIKRSGVTAEVWAVREFLDHRAAVGLGGGPYFARDAKETGSEYRVLGLFTMMIGYRWSQSWSTRAYWHRTLTTNGRDTDVIIGLGMGYAF